MKSLYFNPETKVIFGSDEPQTGDIQAISNISIPDLIANGATVDASANDVPNASVSSTGTANESSANADALAAQEKDAPAIGSATDVEAGNVESSDSISSKPSENADASAGTEPVLTPEQQAEQDVVDAGTAPAGDPAQGEFLPADGSEPVVGDHPAHDAVNALDRFMERVSNDFMSEGKALVAAIRAEVSKLL